MKKILRGTLEYTKVLSTIVLLGVAGTVVIFVLAGILLAVSNNVIFPAADWFVLTTNIKNPSEVARIIGCVGISLLLSLMNVAILYWALRPTKE